MNYTITKNDNKPAYLVLYNYLVNDIVNGVYPYGSKLPSKRLIAQETGVSVITVQHSMELLCDEGYIEARERSGFFVIYRAKDFQGAPNLFYTTHTEPVKRILDDTEYTIPYGVISKIMRKVILDYDDRILDRCPASGVLDLREEICLYLARSRGIKVDVSQVIIGSGAEYLYGMIAQFFGTKEIFAIEDPSYEKIRKVYEIMGIKCEGLKLYPDGIAADDLNKTNAKVLHVTPFNSYPSGISIGVSKKNEYIEWARKKGGVIVEDNYDSELTVSSKPEDSLYSMADGENVIYMNTFSKTIYSSLRVGYMVIPLNMVDKFSEKLGFYSCTVPIFEQYVLTEFLRSGEYERHINRIRRKKRKLHN
ncbi:MAG: PLP-dependent aminotransferase family protein [Lachnospiraceae bacterium]|nr:PLP-dependent aminotransferase family protein [Lachnospiraceae bacterium]